MTLTWCRLLVPIAAVFAVLLPAHAQQQPQLVRPGQLREPSQEVAHSRLLYGMDGC